MTLTITAAEAKKLTTLALSSQIEDNLAHLRWQIQVAAKAGRSNTTMTVNSNISGQLAEIIKQNGFTVVLTPKNTKISLEVSWTY